MFEPHLVAISGQMKGHTFALQDEFPIGRHGATVPLDHMSVSRHHCLIRKEGAVFIVKDLGSHNGTIVNGTPVNERILEHGDQILIGDSEFAVVLSDEDMPALSAEVHFVDQRIDLTQAVVMPAANAAYLRQDRALAQSVTDARVRQDLSALLRIGTTVNDVDRTGSFQTRLMDLILEVIPADGGAILIAPPGAPASSLVAEGFKGAQSVSRTIVDRVLKERTAILTNHIQADGIDALSLKASAARALLCVPLLVRDRAMGAIYLVRTTNESPFDEGHLQLLTAIAAMTAGPLDAARQVAWLQTENKRLQTDIDSERQMIGTSAAIKEIYSFISRVAPTDSGVLIGGESGTGKELVARAIHRMSARSRMPFIAVNCAALTETLVETELFGHERGAFTGAISQSKGKFESAEGGTIFLDEVGELPLSTQAKLLRVLQEREVNRVGNPRAIKVNVRVIAATNRDLEDEMRNGRFRKDLFYRLNVVTATIPPLRNRRDDIMPLAKYFLAKSNMQCNRRIVGISPEAAAAMMTYEWPGNVRELGNAVERAVVLGLGDTILLEDLPEALLDTAPGNSAQGNGAFHDSVRDTKIAIIQRVLAQTGGNHAEAAKLLGLNRTYLHRLIRTLGI